MHRPFLKTVFTALLSAVSITSVSAQTHAPTLITAKWLADHIHDPDLVLLAVGDKKEFELEHISGAQFISLQDISTPAGQGLDLELPSADVLQEAFEKRGISNDSRIVVYFGKDSISPAARVLFTLGYVGLGDQTSLLDGGMLAWQTDGNPITSEVMTSARGKLILNLHPEMIVDTNWVAKHIHDPSLALIDARRPEVYASNESNNPLRNGARPGHIPGAQNIPLESLITDTTQLKDAASIADLFRSVNIKPGQSIVTYCAIGQRATLVWFAARLLGYDAYLYDGSWEDWSAHKELPVEINKPAIK